MPHCSLDGSRTKNGKAGRATLALEPGRRAAPLACVQAPWNPVFALPEKTALMLHADLRRCGIEPVDAQGRVVDTHSLRHGYISALARAGVPIKVAQTLARHSDPKLTMNVYSHLTAFDLHGAIADALPDLTSRPPKIWWSQPAPISQMLPNPLPGSRVMILTSSSKRGYVESSADS